MQAILIDSMGDDNRVVNAARQSFAKEASQFTKEQNDKLIGYLAKHNHWGPFAHCMATFHITAPIFVARQLAKHQVGLVWSEASRRYIDSEPDYYVPRSFRKRPPSSIKQGSGEEFINTQLRSDLIAHAARSNSLYKKLLDSGIAPEQARTILPINMYTEWYWTGSMEAWARVASLRLKDDAQYETREVVRIIAEKCNRLWPVSWSALSARTSLHESDSERNPIVEGIYEELKRIRRSMSDDLK